MVKTKQSKKQAAPAKQDVLSLKRTAKPTSSSASASAGNTLSRTRTSKRQVKKEEKLTPEAKNAMASKTPRNDLAGSAVPHAAASPAKKDQEKKSRSKVAAKDVTKVKADEHQSKRQRKNTAPRVKEDKKRPAEKVVVDLNSGSSSSVDSSSDKEGEKQTSLVTPTETTYLGYAQKSHVFLVALNSSCSLAGHSEMFDPEKNIQVLLRNYPGTPLDKGASYAVSFDISGNAIGFIKIEFVKDVPLAPFNKMHLQLAEPPTKQIALTGQIRFVGDIQYLHQNDRILKHRSVEVWVMCADEVLEIVGIVIWGTYTHHRDLTVNALLLFMGMSQTPYMGKTRFNLGERGAIVNVSDMEAALKIKKKVSAIVGFDEAKAAASLPKGFKIIK